MKYALGVEYSGTAYCGWQRQPHCESIQQNLETALGFVANHPVELVCAGRTDAGLPVGVQVVGPWLQDVRLLEIAAKIDAAIGGFTPPPAYSE